MNKRIVYAILAFLLVFGIFYLEEYWDEIEINSVTETGKVDVVSTTNDFFLPTSTTGQVIHHEGYSLSYSEQHEQAEWVAYELKKEHISTTNFKRPYFEVDESVKTKAAHWRNYKNSGYDRGHLCPAADRAYSKFAYEQTFLTSNISPQKHDFNSGIWNRLEQKVRYWASRYDGVYVVTGGVLKGQLKTIGEERVAVPNQFYKIILDYNNGNPKAIAFLIPHQDSDRPLYEYVVSVDKIESLTGIDFFSKLEDAVEDKIEASDSYKNWRF